MLLRTTLDFFFLYSSNIFQRNSLTWKLLSKWNCKSHRKGNHLPLPLTWWNQRHFLEYHKQRRRTAPLLQHRKAAACPAVVPKSGFFCPVCKKRSTAVGRCRPSPTAAASMPQVRGMSSRWGLLSGFLITCFCLLWEEYENVAVKPLRPIFLPSSSTLYSVFALCLCNFSRLTDVQRKI